PVARKPLAAFGRARKLRAPRLLIAARLLAPLGRRRRCSWPRRGTRRSRIGRRRCFASRGHGQAITDDSFEKSLSTPVSAGPEPALLRGFARLQACNERRERRVPRHIAIIGSGPAGYYTAE